MDLDAVVRMLSDGVFDPTVPVVNDSDSDSPPIVSPGLAEALIDTGFCVLDEDLFIPELVGSVVIESAVAVAGPADPEGEARAKQKADRRRAKEAARKAKAEARKAEREKRRQAVERRDKRCEQVLHLARRRQDHKRAGKAQGKAPAYSGFTVKETRTAVQLYCGAAACPVADATALFALLADVSKGRL